MHRITKTLMADCIDPSPLPLSPEERDSVSSSPEASRIADFDTVAGNSSGALTFPLNPFLRLRSPKSHTERETMLAA